MGVPRTPDASQLCYTNSRNHFLTSSARVRRKLSGVKFVTPYSQLRYFEKENRSTSDDQPNSSIFTRATLATMQDYAYNLFFLLQPRVPLLCKLLTFFSREGKKREEMSNNVNFKLSTYAPILQRYNLFTRRSINDFCSFSISLRTWCPPKPRSQGTTTRLGFGALVSLKKRGRRAPVANYRPCARKRR